MSNQMVSHRSMEFNSAFQPSDVTIGQRLYANGKSLDACMNEEQRWGWQQVANADADADTAAYLAGRDEHVEWMIEADEIRHGWM